MDDVIVIADRAITDLRALEILKYDNKLLSGVIRNVIFRYTGSEDIYQIFVRYVVGDLVILRDDQEHYTYQNMMQKFCMIMNLLRRIRENVREA